MEQQTEWLLPADGDREAAINPHPYHFTGTVEAGPSFEFDRNRTATRSTESTSSESTDTSGNESDAPPRASRLGGVTEVAPFELGKDEVVLESIESTGEEIAESSSESTGLSNKGSEAVPHPYQISSQSEPSFEGHSDEVVQPVGSIGEDPRELGSGSHGNQ